jgi:2-oxoglutarate ferredoxin oxidoreductase subunit beta
VLRAAAAHPGSSFIEIYQNCNVFNDGAFDAVRAKGKEANRIRLVDGEPIRFGADGERGVVRAARGRLEIAEVSEVGEEALVVHDADDPALAYALARLADRPTGPTPVGVFRASERPIYGDAISSELAEAREQVREADLAALLRSGETWTIESTAGPEPAA